MEHYMRAMVGAIIMSSFCRGELSTVEVSSDYTYGRQHWLFFGQSTCLGYPSDGGVWYDKERSIRVRDFYLGSDLVSGLENSHFSGSLTGNTADGTLGIPSFTGSDNLIGSIKPYGYRIGWGFELIFAAKLFGSRKVPVYLTKVAQGGERIKYFSKGTVLYNRLISRMTDMMDDTSAPIPSGIVFIQGGADSNKGTAIAKAYQAQLEKLISDLRSDTGKPKLKFIMVSVGEFYCSIPDGGGRIVYNAQKAVCAADENALFVDAMKYRWEVNRDSKTQEPGTTNQDPVHYSSWGNVKGGHDVFAEVMAAFGEDLGSARE